MELEERLAAFSAGLRAERPWRNVQNVLLSNFEALAELLELQTRRVMTAEAKFEAMELRQRELEQKLERNKEEETRATKRMIAKWRSEDERRVKKQVGQIVSERNAELVSQWGEFVDRAINEAWASRCQEMEIKFVNLLKSNDIEHNLINLLEEKSSKTEDTLRSEMIAQVERLNAEIKALSGQLDALKTAPSPPISKQLEALALDLEQGAIQAAVEMMTNELGHLDARFSKQLAAWRDEIDRAFASKVDRNELVKLLSRKMDTIDGWKQLDGKASLARLEELESKVGDVLQSEQHLVIRNMRDLRALCDSKADAHEFEQLKYSMHDLLAVAESLQLKMSRVCSATAQLPEANQQDIDCKNQSNPTIKLELERVTSQLDAVKRQLRSEIYQARYIWKDGGPTTRQTIAWNTQVLNTNADIFQWKPGSDRVRLLVPGLYYVQVSFFTNMTPTVHVRINGEAVLSLKAPSPLSSSAATQSIRTAGIIQRILHSTGNIAGLTLDGVLALPVNALLAISYDCHERAQGFLSLRKL